MDTFDITKYIDMALRRKWWIIIPFLVTILGGLSYWFVAPKIYQAETLILVQPQSVPQDIVTPIVSTSVEDRLRTITQQVMSRTNLESVIKQYGLFSDYDSRMLMDDKVALMRKDITIDVSHGARPNETNAFTIQFRGRDPGKVMDVTNTLASNFISENLDIRESQATGTSSFLSEELQTMKARLQAKDKAIKKYREKYMGGLPEQLQTNLSILERLQNTADRDANNLSDAENRKLAIQKEMADTVDWQNLAEEDSGNDQAQGQDDLAKLKEELASLRARYTDEYPDVIRLKATIARLETERTKNPAPASAAPASPQFNRVTQTLQRQLMSVNLDIKGLRHEIAENRSQIKWYQKMVENTPKREEELAGLMRDYNNIKNLYNTLLNKKLEAEIAVSMEKKQKGERFQVIDSAILPDRPIKPEPKRVLIITLVLALGLGGGLAYLVEMLDTSYKSPEEVEKELEAPVLVSMPMRYTEKELRRMKVRKVLTSASVSVGFVAAVFAIFVAAKGMDRTLAFIRMFIQGI